eukprot:g3980.t1
MTQPAILFSGQGAQKIGMARDWIESSATARDLADKADHALGYSLTDIMFEGPADSLTATSKCQPALYLHGLIGLALLKERLPNLQPSAAAGLSLGEFTAHAAAGTFSFLDGLRLVSQRGTFMEEACNATNGSMAALIGGEVSKIEELAAATGVDIANLNAPGQIVLSGSAEKIDEAVAKAKDFGIRRAIKLNVAGAYHSSLMSSAQEKLAAELNDTTITTPSIPVVANFTAQPVCSEAEIRSTLTSQVTGSVRWIESIQHLVAAGQTHFIEIGPGKVIAGLVAKIAPEATVISVEDVPSLEAAASRKYYEHLNSNIHRGTHHLARAATDAHEQARETISRHLNAPATEEVIFTSGTTDSINLVANILHLNPGDEILISTLEHHSNIVPWQMLAERSGASLRIIPCDENGVLDQMAFRGLLSGKTKIMALTWVSNAFGTVNPVAEMAAEAKKHGTTVLLDAAQAIPHLSIDVQALPVDFIVFSGHKIYAPTGVGILWGRKELLDSLPPWRGGGEMIKEVTFEHTTYNDLPFKYEAGTPNIEGGIALAAAIDYVNSIGIEEIYKHEKTLIRQAAAALSEIPGIRLFGPEDRVGALSFAIEGVHHYDLGTLIDQMGVAVRTGHHCCQPLMARFGITGTTRASFALYNTEEDIESLTTAVKKAAMMLS